VSSFSQRLATAAFTLQDRSSHRAKCSVAICSVSSVLTLWWLVWLLLYAHTHRSILGAADHIILTPANQLMVMGLKIMVTVQSGFEPATFRLLTHELTNCSNRAHRLFEKGHVKWNLLLGPPLICKVTISSKLADLYTYCVSRISSGGFSFYLGLPFSLNILGYKTSWNTILYTRIRSKLVVPAEVEVDVVRLLLRLCIVMGYNSRHDDILTICFLGFWGLSYNFPIVFSMTVLLLFAMHGGKLFLWFICFCFRALSV
jgi:hypothetical protein